MITDRRIGRFRVSLGLLEKGEPTLKAFMASVLILGAEYDFSSQSVEYMGTHESFRELDAGERAPEYDIIFTKVGGDEGSIVYGTEFKELT